MIVFIMQFLWLPSHYDHEVSVKLFTKGGLPATFLLRLSVGTAVQYGIHEYPRMRLKRNVIFGFADLWGELL
jgi:hypothetical protein